MEELIHRLEQTALESDFSGVVSIFKGSSEVFQKAFGYRNVKNELPNRTDTLFGIASGTKLFTALGIGRLIDQGVIALDTAVGDIDSRYAGFIDPGATVRQLLSHTSGLFDYYDEEIIEDFDDYHLEIPWFKLETPSDYWPLFEDRPMKFRPGERYSYSNGGYVFLGILIEKLAGMLYRDFIGEQVLTRAGMRCSGFFPFNDLPANTANGYFKDRRTTNIYQLPLRGGGDGGMYTTAEDLRALWKALFSREILSGELTDAFLSTHWRFDEVDGYGCGIYKRLDDSMFSIVGGDAGVDFVSRHLVGECVTISIISNITEGEGKMGHVVLDYLSQHG